MKVLIELNKKALSQRNMTSEEVAGKIEEELGYQPKLKAIRLYWCPVNLHTGSFFSL